MVANSGAVCRMHRQTGVRIAGGSAIYMRIVCCGAYKRGDTGKMNTRRELHWQYNAVACYAVLNITEWLTDTVSPCSDV